MLLLVGHVRNLIRHPVKSFTGEHVNETSIMPYGLYGDRSHAYLDETRPGKFLTITQAPQMASYKAYFSGPDQFDTYPETIVWTPDGRQMKWNDSTLLDELEAVSGRKISPIRYKPEFVPIGPIEKEHILLVTDASIQALADKWGKPVDYNRFRPNLVLTLTEKHAYTEETWLGGRLLIGDTVELSINRSCDRCMIITVDPPTGEKDASLLKLVAGSRQNHFGVYCSVVKTGLIRTGDAVRLVM